jgi:hypothetical protein
MLFTSLARSRQPRSTARLDSLIANAHVIDENGRPRLTDPMFEHWLRSRGLTPTGGGDYDEDDE